MRQVPWQSWEHWKWVATELFSDSTSRVSGALDRIAAWQSRGKVPIAVETSAAIVGIHQRDPQVTRGLPQESSLPGELLRMMYAMAIQRLVNGVVDQSQKRNVASVADRAELAGLPRLLVDIRHEAAHNELPGLSLLQLASKQALEWLKLHYWDQQKEMLVNARMDLKSKLVEHARVVVEILSPRATAADLQQFNDSDDKSEEHVEVVPQETLKVKKQQRSRLFNELVDLSLSSTSDLISILVHDGLLEQRTLPKSDEPYCEHTVKTGPMDGLDLASTSDTAWKFTLRKLSSHMPRLPEMLLVAIIKHINSSSLQRVIVCSAEEAGPILFQGSDDHIFESTGPAARDSSARNRLTAWCAWLLGKNPTEDINHSSGKEPQTAKLLKISNARFVTADLSKEFLGELLRMCLYSSDGRGPLVELVPLISVQLGSNRFQHQAAALAELGTSLQIADWNTTDRSESTQIGEQVAVEESTRESSVKKVATASFPGGDSSLGSQSSVESALEMARSRQKSFFARLLSQKHDKSPSKSSRSKEPSADSTLKSPKTGANSSSISSLGDKNSSHQTDIERGQEVSDTRNWTLVKNWRPCAIGMIPSPCNSVGIMPSLDMQRHGDPVVSNRQDEVRREENPANGSAMRAVDKDNSAVADTVEQVVGKRTNDEPLDGSTSGKKLKKTGRHVHFEDKSHVDAPGKAVARDLCGTSPTQPVTLDQAQSPEKEQIVPRSLLQGCLLRHGMFMPASPQQLESLQAAVHVL